MEAPSILASDNRTVQLNGAHLAGLRRARALTREQLADAAEGAHRLSVATIKRAERGAPVYLETARRLAGLLGVDVRSLLATTRQPDAFGVRTGSGSSDGPVAVAVLPFRVIGADAEASLLAEGIVEDLTTRLGNWWFPVISRASTLHYPTQGGRADAARELHVGYLVEGSVQRKADKVRVHARLIAAHSGEQLWAAECNRTYSELFVLQDELAGGIVDGVNHKLLELELRRVEQRDPDDLRAWELAVRGSRFFYEKCNASNREARALLTRAVDCDPNAAWAYYLLAMTHQQDIINQWSNDPAASLKALAGVSAEFERHHRGDARADVVAAYLMVYEGARDAAADRLHAAIAGAPNLNVAYSLLGQTMAMGNDPDRALEQLEMAARLSPRDADLWSVKTATALAHFVAERYEDTLLWAEMAIELRPDIAFAFGTVAAASALSGDVARAKNALARMMSLQPTMSAGGFGVILASTEPEIAKRYLYGLRLAGFAM